MPLEDRTRRGAVGPPANRSAGSGPPVQALETGRGQPTSRRGRRSEPAAGSNKPHDQQEHDGADRGIDDLRYEAGAEVDA